MAVHVFGCRMSNDVCAKLKRTTVDRSCKCVVHDQRNTMFVCDPCKLFNIQHHKSRIGNCFTKHSLRVRTECLLKFFFGSIRIHQGYINTLFLYSNGEKIGCSSVNSRCTDNMIPCIADIKCRIIVCCLTGRCEHCSHAALQFTNLLSDCIVGRIGQSCVKISIFFQIKQTSHLFAGRIFKGCTLIDREDSRLTILWLPATLNADSFQILFTISHTYFLLLLHFHSQPD